jgi:5'-phosphate synthase pdxT subunit
VPDKAPKVGILALQGAVREHVRAVAKAGGDPVQIKWPSELEAVDGLIIPGGESTAIGKMMKKYGFIDAVRLFASQGRPIYGTCAGLILLADRITEGTIPWLRIMDIEARRNAFGRQQESFEADLEITGFDRPFPGIFIRAPLIESAGPEVSVMAEYAGKAVMARQENLLVTAFHPELTDDVRIHSFFVNMIKKNRG